MEYLLMADSAAPVTLPLLEAWDSKYGRIDVVARYLGNGHGAATPLTAEEAAEIHAAGRKLLVIYNDATSTSVKEGTDVGRQDAAQAILAARKLGMPAGVYLAVDLEHEWPVTSDWLLGFCAAMRSSEYGGAGIIYAQYEPWFTVPWRAAMRVDTNGDVARALIWDAWWTDGKPDPNQEGSPLRHPECVAWQFASEGDCDLSWIKYPLPSVGPVAEGLWEPPPRIQEALQHLKNAEKELRQAEEGLGASG